MAYSSSRRVAGGASPVTAAPLSPADTDVIAAWLNERPPSSSSSAVQQSTSLFGMLRSFLYAALLEVGSEDSIVSFAEDIQASIAMSLSSELYAPPPAHKQRQLAKIRNYSPSVTSTTPLTSSSSIGGQHFSPSLLRAAQVALGVFQVPSDALWRHNEIECVLCSERFMVDNNIAMASYNTPGQRTRRGGGNGKRLTKKAMSNCDGEGGGILLDLRTKWCNEVVAHAIDVHVRRRGIGACVAPKVNQDGCDSTRTVSSRRHAKRARDDREGLTALAYGTPFSIEEVLLHDKVMYSIPLRTLHHDIMRSASCRGSEDDDSGNTTTPPQPLPTALLYHRRHRHVALRHASALTDLVFREALLCPCSSGAWLREEDE
jgi:hypothetical protein